MKRIRSALSVVLGVLAVVGLMASVLGVWARGVLFDSAKVGEAVERALAEPAVTEGLAESLADSVFVASDVDESVERLLPQALDRYGTAMVDGVHQQIVKAFTALLRSDTTQAVLVRAAEVSHQELMRVLQGDGLADGVTVADGRITLNTLPLLGRGFEKLTDLGLLKDVTIPEMSADGDPEEQRAQLEAALGRDLPDDFGQVVVFQGDAVESAEATVAAAQRAVLLVKRAIGVILVVTVVAFLASVLTARHRARATVVLLLSATVAMLLARLLIDRFVDRAPQAVASPAGRAAIAAMVVDLSRGLLSVITVVIVVALAAAVAAYFVNPGTAGHRALRSRGWSGAVAFVTEHRESVIVGSAATALVVLAGFGLGAAQLILATGAVAVGLWAWSQRPKHPTAAETSSVVESSGSPAEE